MPNEVLNGKEMDARPNHAAWAQPSGKRSSSSSKHWQRRAGTDRSDEEEGCGAKEGRGGKGKVAQGTRKYKEQTSGARQGQTGARAGAHCGTRGAGCTRKAEATSAVL